MLGAVTATLALSSALRLGRSPLGCLRGGRSLLSPLLSSSLSEPALRVIDAIEAPALDRRTYRHVELPSGLRALLVSDPATEKAAAALEVSAGHFDDPEGLAGLAHFTEHMMFLGTRKYPDERAFKDFISRHGGSSNAFTGMESTGYHFGVNANQLKPALDRFASFFTEPLLREDSARREMQAVHSEFQRNLQSDQRRLFQLIKSTSDHSHPFHKFSTGSLETLSNVQVLGLTSPEQAVRAFYEHHYQPHRMTLAILGRESLDELTRIVSDAFSGLVGQARNTDATVARALAAVSTVGGSNAVMGPARGPLSDEQVGGLLYMSPVREARLLRFLWQAEPETAYVASRAPRLTAHILSSEVEGSLSWLLTKEMQPPLATSVSASSAYSLRDASIFSLSVSLTPDGLQRYEECRLWWSLEEESPLHNPGWLLLQDAPPMTGAVLETHGTASRAALPTNVWRPQVASIVHSALNLLRETAESHGASGGLPVHLRAERATMSRLGFEYGDEAEPLAAVKTLASRMHTPGLPPTEILTRPYTWDAAAATDPAPLRAFLDLLRPHRALTILVAPGFDAPKTERWYGTPYNLTPLPRSTLDAWATAEPHPLLKLPPPNPLVPDQFDLIEPRSAAVEAPSRPPRRSPNLLGERAGLRAWHLGVGSFARPKASALVLLRSPHVIGSARSVVLSTLALELLEDNLSTTLAAAPDAGAGWAMGVHAGGLIFQASGYSQRVSDLSLVLAKAFANFEPKADRFELRRELLAKALRNRREERPLWQAQYELSHAMTQPTTHYEQALAFAIDESVCTLDALRNHLGLLRSSGVFIEAFLHGNSWPADASALADGWAAALGAPAIDTSDAPLPATLSPRVAATRQRAEGAGELSWDSENGGVDAASAPEGTFSPGTLRLRSVASNPEETNSGCELHLHVGADLSARDEALLRLTSSVASKDAFHFLRTVRQLGYVVSCGVRSVGDARGLSVLVQSAVASPTSLEIQMEEWLADFRSNTLTKLSPETIADSAASLATNLEEPPRSLGQEAGPLWGEIIEGTHYWHRDIEVAQEVRTMTKDDLIAFWDTYFAAGAPKRQRVVSSCFSHSDAIAEGVAIPQRKARVSAQRTTPMPQTAVEIGAGEVTDT